MSSYLTTGTRGRKHLVPDVASDTIALIGATQTLVGKTLTSPTITTPTFSTAAASFVGGTGGAVTDGLLLGGGTSATNCATATAGKNFAEFYTSSTATSGDSRGLYWRHFFSGTGGSGEALRAVGIVNNKTVATGGTVNGAHISLEMDGASAKISGQANAIRATFMTTATPTTIGGTCSVIDVETNVPNTTTLPTNMAFMRFINLDASKPTYLFSIEAPAAGMFVTAGTTGGSPGASGGAACQKVVPLLVDGVVHYLALYTSNA